jgi:CheY-like chemotaxis protein
MASVLCIDDNAQCLGVRKLLLEIEGFSVLTARTGPRGLKLLSQTPVNAIVLDYKMPHMDGLEVARAIRLTHGSLPILLLSGYPHLPKELLEIVDSFVMKGQAADVLIKELRRLTGTKRKPPARASHRQATGRRSGAS